MGVPVGEVFAATNVGVAFMALRMLLSVMGGCKANEQMKTTVNICVNKHNCVFA